MRRSVIALAALFIAVSAFAADSSHEIAARQFFAAWMKIDKPRLVQAFAGAVGAIHPQTRAVVLEALDSPEFEAIYVKNLVATFSEPELRNLLEMTGTAAFRLFSERMPLFTERALPEVALFFKANAAELSKRAAEKQKQRRALCQMHGPRQLPGRIKDSALDVLSRAKQNGYICGEALEDKLAKVMYVVCTNETTYCDDFAVINFRYDMTTMQLEAINIGRSTELIEALSRQGRLARGWLPIQ